MGKFGKYREVQQTSFRRKYRLVTSEFTHWKNETVHTRASIGSELRG